MLRSLKDLEHYKVNATDGDVGSVEDFLLDDDRWTIRYLIVETKGWLDGREVLVSPLSFRNVDWDTQRFHLALTRQKIENSPSIDVDKPVSRQHERDFYGYYGYPYYWGAMGATGGGAWATPPMLAPVGRNDPPASGVDSKPSDPRLRSAKEVRGYHIQGSDGEIGHVADFIVDDETWEIRYLVVDTSNWWRGKKVLVAPRWATSVRWEERKVHVAMSRDWIKGCPAWDSNAAVNREYETCLYDYHGRPVYWAPSDPIIPPTGASAPLHDGPRSF